MGGLASTSGGEVDLLVPSGNQRLFQLFGLVSTIGCQSFQQLVAEGLINGCNNGSSGCSNGMSNPIYLGSTTSDVIGDTSLSIQASYSSASAELEFCNDSSNNPMPTSGGGPFMLAPLGQPPAVGYGACVPLAWYYEGNRNPGITVPVTISGSAQIYTNSSCGSPASTNSLTRVGLLPQGMTPGAAVALTTSPPAGSGYTPATSTFTVDSGSFTVGFPGNVSVASGCRSGLSVTPTPPACTVLQVYSVNFLGATGFLPYNYPSCGNGTYLLSSSSLPVPQGLQYNYGLSYLLSGVTYLSFDYPNDPLGGTDTLERGRQRQRPTDPIQHAPCRI